MAVVDRSSSVKQTYVDGNGVTLDVVEQGEGPAVSFVHGFPDGWRGWRRQMAAIATEGYRAIAFDARGYGENPKPKTLRSTLFSTTSVIPSAF